MLLSRVGNPFRHPSSPGSWNWGGAGGPIGEGWGVSEQREAGPCRHHCFPLACPVLHLEQARSTSAELSVFSGALQTYSRVTSLFTAGSGRRRLGVRALEMHRAVLWLCEGDERAIRQDRGDPLQLHQQVPGGRAVAQAAQGAGREGQKPEGELLAHLKCYKLKWLQKMNSPSFL